MNNIVPSITCSCGTVWPQQPTDQDLAQMVIHWKGQHSLRITSEGPTDFIVGLAGRQAIAQRLRAWKALYWPGGSS